ncbi:hypothetical protein Tco_1312403 [Tanacetum coccineum]
MKMENPVAANIKTSHGRFNITAGNPVKKILLKLNLSDHSFIITVLADYLKCGGVPDSSWLTRILSHMLIRPDNIRHHVISSRYEHVGPEVASSQDGKITRWQRDCAWLMISRCSRSQCQIQVQGTSSIQEVNDHYNIFTRESQEYELKTKDKASIMTSITAQQTKLDLELVPKENGLDIGKCNGRIPRGFSPREHTF